MANLPSLPFRALGGSRPSAVAAQTAPDGRSSMTDRCIYEAYPSGSALDRVAVKFPLGARLKHCSPSDGIQPPVISWQGFWRPEGGTRIDRLARSIGDLQDNRSVSREGGAARDAAAAGERWKW
jgi:hypothetical protein